jgi:arginine exporter protein ArgO
MVQQITVGFAILFGIVVSLGYIPPFITDLGEGEKLMFNLFKISLFDDITHGVTAIAALAAGLHSRKASLLFLTAFGFYYALDATFYLIYGLFNELTWVQDVLLNAPHVAISATMLAIVYWFAPRSRTVGPHEGEP